MKIAYEDGFHKDDGGFLLIAANYDDGDFDIREEIKEFLTSLIKKHKDRTKVAHMSEVDYPKSFVIVKAKDRPA